MFIKKVASVALAASLLMPASVFAETKPVQATPQTADLILTKRFDLHR